MRRFPSTIVIAYPCGMSGSAMPTIDTIKGVTCTAAKPAGPSYRPYPKSARLQGRMCFPSLVQPVIFRRREAIPAGSLFSTGHEHGCQGSLLRPHGQGGPVSAVNGARLAADQ